MKRYFHSLALALCALMLAMPVKAYEQQTVHADHFNTVRMFLEDCSSLYYDVVVTLDADLEINDKWYTTNDVSLAHSARILRVDNNAPSQYWRNKGLEKYSIAYRYGNEKIAAFVSVGQGRKTLDLNGHTITAAWYGDNARVKYKDYNGYPKCVCLFAAGWQCNEFNIIDSQGGGKIIFNSYEGNATEVAAVFVPKNSTCERVNICGGEINGCAPWSNSTAGDRCGVVMDDENVTLNMYGGKINLLDAYEESHVNMLGGEVSNNSGVYFWTDSIVSAEENYFCPVAARPENFYYANGVIHGVFNYCALKLTENEWKERVPAQKKYYFSFNEKELSYDQFITNLRIHANSRFRIMNGDFVPVIVNGIGLADDNAGDILGDGGSVSWNEPTKTLTLRNADVTSVVMNYTGSENLEYVIKVEGKSSVHGSGIKCTGAHLSIEGSEEDTLVVFGAGCKAIECDNQILLHNLYVDASATSTNAIVATTLIVDGAPLKAEAQTRAVACDISYWQDIIYTYNYTSGSATSASFTLDVDLRKYKIWIAGKQMNIRNADDFKSDYTSGKISIADNSRGKWTEGCKIILMLENASINAQSLYNGYSGLNPKGVPAIEIQEDSVTVIMDNVTIYSGDPKGVKYDGIDTRYYADGGHGIYFKPAHNNCELILRSNTDKITGENGSVYINTCGKNQSSYPIRCEGPRLYIKCSGSADSIVIHSEREVYCKTGLTLDNATIYSQSGFKTANTPVITTAIYDDKELQTCYVAWPRAGVFNSTGGIQGSTDNVNQGVLVCERSRHPLPYFVEPNDESMGYCNPSSFEINYGRALNIKANPNTGYKFKEWHIYRKGKSGYLTLTDAEAAVDIITETRCVAMFEPSAGTPKEYNVWLKDVRVTSENCLDPAGDKKSEYKDADGLGQITLNGVNWAVDGPAIYTDGISEVRVYCNGSNTIKGQSDWTLYFDEADIVRIYFDTLNVGFHEANTDDKGIQFVNTSNTAVLELRNKLTKITGNSEDHVAIITDTLKLIEGNELQVSGCGMEIRGGLVIPENYMIYPEGTYLAENGTMRDAENNEVRTFRIAPKDPETPKYTITVNVNDPIMGSATGGGIFEEGEEVSLTATPNDGYEFVEWSNGSTENPFIAPACMDATVTAIFREIGSQGIEDIIANPQSTAHKRIQNGQLFIERNGQIYNAQGIKVQ